MARDSNSADISSNAILAESAKHPFADDIQHEAFEAERTHLSTEEENNFPMPSFEQVAKNMARALRFPSACPHQAEFACQLAEGRKMSRSEKEGNAPRRDELQDRSTRSTPANFFQNPHQVQGINGGTKKRRSRNRSHGGSKQVQSTCL